MTPQQVNLMRHALGLDNQNKPYRNRYYGQRLSKAGALWDDLVDRGLAWRGPDDDGDGHVMWAVTDEGITALGVMVLDGLEPSERFTARMARAS